MRRPLGLFLQGGGALGAWQAGALAELSQAGLAFDAVMGYSIGAVNAAALALGRFPEAMAQWRVAGLSMLKPQLHFSPLAFFSSEPLRAFLAWTRDDDAAKTALRLHLTVISACPAQATPIYAHFTPGGRAGWDGPLLEQLIASCSIPLIMPAVDLAYRGRRLRLIDGGIPMDAPFNFSPLAHCSDVLVLEMIRSDEVGRHVWTPWRRIDQRSRETSRELVDGGVTGLLQAQRPPRVFRLEPSSCLSPMILDFRARGLKAMLALGAQDARSLLATLERHQVR